MGRRATLGAQLCRGGEDEFKDTCEVGGPVEEDVGPEEGPPRIHSQHP